MILPYVKRHFDNLRSTDHSMIFIEDNSLVSQVGVILFISKSNI